MANLAKAIAMLLAGAGQGYMQGRDRRLDREHEDDLLKRREAGETERFNLLRGDRQRGEQADLMKHVLSQRPNAPMAAYERLGQFGAQQLDPAQPTDLREAGVTGAVAGLRAVSPGTPAVPRYRGGLFAGMDLGPTRDELEEQQYTRRRDEARAYEEEQGLIAEADRIRRSKLEHAQAKELAGINNTSRQQIAGQAAAARATVGQHKDFNSFLRASTQTFLNGGGRVEDLQAFRTLLGDIWEDPGRGGPIEQPDPTPGRGPIEQPDPTPAAFSETGAGLGVGAPPPPGLIRSLLGGGLQGPLPRAAAQARASNATAGLNEGRTALLPREIAVKEQNAAANRRRADIYGGNIQSLINDRKLGQALDRAKFDFERTIKNRQVSVQEMNAATQRRKAVADAVLNEAKFDLDRITKAAQDPETKMRAEQLNAQIKQIEANRIAEEAALNQTPMTDMAKRREIMGRINSTEPGLKRAIAELKALRGGGNRAAIDGMLKDVPVLPSATGQPPAGRARARNAFIDTLVKGGLSRQEAEKLATQEGYR